MTDETPIWLEPVRGGYPDPRVLGLSGLEQMRAFLRYQGPRPPISHLTGMLFEQAGEGTATFSLPPSPWLQSPSGAFLGGVLAVLADGPLGSAIQVALPPATLYTTAELSMTFLRPATTASGKITAHGQLIHAGKSLGLSEVFVLDAEERLLAHGTSRCYIFPPFDPAPDPPPDDFRPEIPVYDTPDPHDRPVQGEVIPQDVWDRMSGLEMMKAWAAGELPPPPIALLTGMRPVGADEGTSTWILPATEWLNAPTGRVEGGIEAMLLDSAIVGAVQTVVPAGVAFATLDLKVYFLRPVVADGRDLTAVGTVDHAGRTLATAHADVSNADGKRVATAVGSVMLLPDRPMSMAPAAEEEPPAADAS